MGRPPRRKPDEPPVDVDALLDAATSLPFSDEEEDDGDETLDEQNRDIQHHLEMPLVTMPELPEAHVPPGVGEGHAVLPCPRCEALNRLKIGDPPRPRRCTRCGADVDPGTPFEVRAHQLDDVIDGTEVAVVLLLAERTSGVWALGDTMRPALSYGHGTFVVGRLDLAEEPQATAQLGIERGPALAMYQGGSRLGVFVLPAVAATAGAMMGKLLGPWITGAPTKGAAGAAPVFPFLGNAKALPAADPDDGSPERSDPP